MCLRTINDYRLVLFIALLFGVLGIIDRVSQSRPKKE